VFCLDEIFFFLLMRCRYDPKRFVFLPLPGHCIDASPAGFCFVSMRSCGLLSADPVPFCFPLPFIPIRGGCEHRFHPPPMCYFATGFQLLPFVLHTNQPPSPLAPPPPLTGPHHPTTLGRNPRPGQKNPLCICIRCLHATPHGVRAFATGTPGPRSLLPLY